MTLSHPLLVRFGYRCLFICGFLVSLPQYLLKMIRRGGNGRAFAQRFGIYSMRTREKVEQAHGGVWMHAVSVGETHLAALIWQRWKELHPQMPVCLTTTTVTGQAVALKSVGADRPVLYSPLDFGRAVRSAFDLMRPSLLVLVEAEIWPGWMWEAQRRGVPVALVNARLSARSEKRYARCPSLVAPFFQSLALVCIQSPSDRARFEALGVLPDRIIETGSMKYDVSALPGSSPDQAWAILAAAGWRQGMPVFLAGSTHPGEEEILAEAFHPIAAACPDTFFVVAPRHAERGKAVAKIFRKAGWKTVLRSHSSLPPTHGQILVLDTTGELRGFYPAATATFIGKSLRGVGGQNFLEPIAAGSPVIVGPDTSNFAPIAEDMRHVQAIRTVTDAGTLAAAAIDLILHPATGQAQADRAQTVFQSRLGAASRTTEALRPWTDPITEKGSVKDS